MSGTLDRLRDERDKLHRLEAQADAASVRVGIPTDDPGALSGLRRSTSPRQARQSEASMSRAITLNRDAERQRKHVEHLAAQVRREERDAKADATATVDLDSLEPGDYIRYFKHGTSNNWAQVVRVNAKTITCLAAPGMDQPKIAKDRIRETRKAGA